MYSFSYAYTRYENNVYHHRRRHRLSSDTPVFSTIVGRTFPIAASRPWKTLPQNVTSPPQIFCSAYAVTVIWSTIIYLFSHLLAYCMQMFRYLYINGSFGEWQ